jgi:hypothetical protein
LTYGKQNPEFFVSSEPSLPEASTCQKTDWYSYDS